MSASWFKIVNSLYSGRSFDSSVGRAVDCSVVTSVIHRSLVRIRFEGGCFAFNFLIGISFFKGGIFFRLHIFQFFKCGFSIAKKYILFLMTSFLAEVQIVLLCFLQAGVLKPWGIYPPPIICLYPSNTAIV